MANCGFLDQAVLEWYCVCGEDPCPMGEGAIESIDLCSDCDHGRFVHKPTDEVRLGGGWLYRCYGGDNHEECLCEGYVPRARILAVDWTLAERTAELTEAVRDLVAVMKGKS